MTGIVTNLRYNGIEPGRERGRTAGPLRPVLNLTEGGIAVTFKAVPFIFLDGQARDAIRFYESALGAQVVFMQTYGEAPDADARQLSDEARGRITHSVLLFGGAELYVADALPGESAHPGPRVQVCITAPDTAASARIFNALKDGGRVIMPLEPIYFSPAYGIVTDRFGVTFQIFTERPGDN